MHHRSYLLFNLDDARYSLAAEVVQEIFPLPALTSVPESGPEVAGILNLRGQLIPTLNLKEFLGHPKQPNTAAQVVILAQCGAQQLGLVVDNVQNVEMIAAANISTALETPYLSNTKNSLTAGVAKHENEVIVLLNLESLGQSGQTLPSPMSGGGGNRFMEQFSSEDQRLLQARADGLAQLLAYEGDSDLTALAVVGLDGEHFGLRLETVYEFTEVPQVTSIPCCPPHIVGNMNLRGEILTLVDIRCFLNLSSAAASKPQKAVVMRSGSLVAGVVIDEVFDVVYLQTSDIVSAPTAIHSNSNQYLRGVASYGDSMMSLLDLPKLLAQGELVVDQPIY